MTVGMPELVPRSWPTLGRNSRHTATTSQGLIAIASTETLHWASEVGDALRAFSLDGGLDGGLVLFSFQ